MQPVEDFMRYLKFTDGLSSSDIIGWVLAAIAGIIAYKLIDHMQTSIERHGMLSSVEDEINTIFNSVIAISFGKNDEWPTDGVISDKNKVSK